VDLGSAVIVLAKHTCGRKTASIPELLGGPKFQSKLAVARVLQHGAEPQSTELLPRARKLLNIRPGKPEKEFPAKSFTPHAQTIIDEWAKIWDEFKAM